MIFVFESLNLAGWIAKYKADIRVVVDWVALSDSGVSVEQAWYEPGHPRGLSLEYPWYKEGGWMREKKVRKFVDYPANQCSNIVVRAPGVRYASSGKAQSLLLLDRCHRVSELKPRLVVLDTLVLKKKSDLRIFGDLL